MPGKQYSVAVTGEKVSVEQIGEICCGRKLWPEDIAKAVFQAKCGCGHLLTSRENVLARIKQEEALLNLQENERLTEKIGSKFIRLNLRPAMAAGIKPEWIAEMMLHSSLPEQNNARKETAETIRKISREQTAISPKLNEIADKIENCREFLPSHSAEYREKYSPAYRVIDAKYAVILPVLQSVASNMSGRTLIAVDGRCGSGKTTLAENISEILGCPVIHADDFYVPMAEKTPERLSQPGGNCCRERLIAQVMEPWKNTGRFTLQKYDCHTDKYSEPEEIFSNNLLILEGSYSLHPDIRKYVDVPVFMTISKDEQKKRIIARDGDYYSVFAEKWIPLEEAYFRAFSLPDGECLVVEGA